MSRRDGRKRFVAWRGAIRLARGCHDARVGHRDAVAAQPSAGREHGGVPRPEHGPCRPAGGPASCPHAGHRVRRGRPSSTTAPAVNSGAVVVAGIVSAALHVRGEDIECLQVRLSPVVAHAALGASPAELDRTVVTLEDVWGRDAARIREQLRDAPSWDDRFAITDAMLLRRHETGPSVDPEVARAWERIVASPRSGPGRRTGRGDRMEPEASLGSVPVPDRPLSQARGQAGPLRSCRPSAGRRPQRSPGRRRRRLCRPVPPPPRRPDLHRGDAHGRGRRAMAGGGRRRLAGIRNIRPRRAAAAHVTLAACSS